MRGKKEIPSSLSLHMLKFQSPEMLTVQDITFWMIKKHLVEVLVRDLFWDWNLLLFVEAACLVVRKDRMKGKDGRNTCKKKWNYWSFISMTSVLDSFWPLCISTGSTVRNGTSAHLSCSATSFPHSCSREFISSHCFTFHTGNFSQDPLLWGLSLPCPLNLLIVVTCSWFLFSFPLPYSFCRSFSKLSELEYVFYIAWNLTCLMHKLLIFVLNCSKNGNGKCYLVSSAVVSESSKNSEWSNQDRLLTFSSSLFVCHIL